MENIDLKSAIAFLEAISGVETPTGVIWETIRDPVFADLGGAEVTAAATKTCANISNCLVQPLLNTLSTLQDAPAPSGDLPTISLFPSVLPRVTRLLDAALAIARATSDAAPTLPLPAHVVHPASNLKSLGITPDNLKTSLRLATLATKPHALTPLPSYLTAAPGRELEPASEAAEEAAAAALAEYSELNAASVLHPYFNEVVRLGLWVEGRDEEDDKLMADMDPFIGNVLTTLSPKSMHSVVNRLLGPEPSAASAWAAANEGAKRQPLLVATPAQLADMLKHEDFAEIDALAFDVEFVAKYSYWGSPALLQLTPLRRLALGSVTLAPSGTTYLVDLLALRREVGPALRPLFADPEIVKIAHDARQDILWLQMVRIFVVNLWDTSVAECVYMDSRGYNPQQRPQSHAGALAGGDWHAGQPKRPGLATLVSRHSGAAPGVEAITLPKDSQLSDWALRPLSAEQVRYAANDTRYLGAVFASQVLQLLLVPHEVVNIGRRDGTFARVWGISKAVCLRILENTEPSLPINLHASKAASEALLEMLSYVDDLARSADRSPNELAPSYLLCGIAKGHAVPTDTKLDAFTSVLPDPAVARALWEIYAGVGRTNTTTQPIRVMTTSVEMVARAPLALPPPPLLVAERAGSGRAVAHGGIRFTSMLNTQPTPVEFVPPARRVTRTAAAAAAAATAEITAATEVVNKGAAAAAPASAPHITAVSATAAQRAAAGERAAGLASALQTVLSETAEKRRLENAPAPAPAPAAAAGEKPKAGAARAPPRRSGATRQRQGELEEFRLMASMKEKGKGKK